MKVEPIEPVYKSTFNKNSNKNDNSKQNKKKKEGERPSVILEISQEGRKKLEEYER